MNILKQERNVKGQYGQKIGWNDIGAIALLIFSIIGIVLSATHARGAETTSGNTLLPEPRIVVTSENNTPCFEIASGTRSYVCADKETLAKWQAYLESEIKTLEVDAGKPSAVLSKVCRDHGFEGRDCPAILYGMAMVESHMKSTAIGDSGKSVGWFQIHLGYHPDIKRSCAMDLHCAADWTLSRMIVYGFGETASVAIMRHNGTPGTPATKKYLAEVMRQSKGF